MKITRKDFLRLSGLGLLAVAGGKAVRAVTERASAVPPAKSVRWGMAIDLEKCRHKDGCDRCIKACHSTHNVPRFADRAHEIKWIWKEPFQNVFPAAQTGYTHEFFGNLPVLLACNHCDDPPCQDVCPVDATWKREDGVVTIDFHRCIGCRYCMAACPYGARSFNWQDPRPAIATVNPNFPDPHPRVWWRSAISAKSGWPRVRDRPAPRVVRKRPSCSAIWSGQTPTCASCCARALRCNANRNWALAPLYITLSSALYGDTLQTLSRGTASTGSGLPRFSSRFSRVLSSMSGN